MSDVYILSLILSYLITTNVFTHDKKELKTFSDFLEKYVINNIIDIAITILLLPVVYILVYKLSQETVKVKDYINVMYKIFEYTVKTLYKNVLKN